MTAATSTPEPPPDPASDPCVAKLKALADPTRLRVVQTLMEGPRHVHELMRRLGVEQSLLSHHLRVLREIGLLTCERDGKAVLYRLAPGVEGTTSSASLHLGCCRLSFAASPRDRETTPDGTEPKEAP